MGLLYDRWQAVAVAHADEIALIQTDAGRARTFAELWQLGEAAVQPQQPVLTASGRDVNFVLEGFACLEIHPAVAAAGR